ncbi:actin depolymerizing factor, putative [Theileria annulata]|uniref:Actin depolymerizing factor, putative n=1 Tax=Theileria annulata TaxID=5874 RepID=Q4UIB8_THEAN|nr:actin depolymerizing factor, putative [Theileria annulata]CAI73171.1 actin depolymerizing factor, putative [Theileria annulata]|eukprot:XP_953849.1 actin depolymerizing factor, putative [Theileria annulata]
MESGIKVSEETVAKFNQMKLKKVKTRYMVLKVKGNFVDVENDGEGDVEELLTVLPNDECTFVVYDKGQNLVLFMFAPSGATTQSRTVYSTTKQTVENALPGVRLHRNLVEDHDEVRDALK